MAQKEYTYDAGGLSLNVWRENPEVYKEGEVIPQVRFSIGSPFWACFRLDKPHLAILILKGL